MQTERKKIKNKQIRKLGCYFLSLQTFSVHFVEEHLSLVLVQSYCARTRTYSGILKVLLVDHIPLPNWILSHGVQQKHADKLEQLLWKILLHVKAQSLERCS